MYIYLLTLNTTCLPIYPYLSICYHLTYYLLLTNIRVSPS